jgi:hypothetical protein
MNILSPYLPETCQWATDPQQAQNKTTSRAGGGLRTPVGFEAEHNGPSPAAPLALRV